MKSDAEAERTKYDNYEMSLPIYIQMVNIAFHAGCKRILEMGAGLSTGLWAGYARLTNAEITSVEVDFGPMRSYVSGTRLEELVDCHVDLREDVTITASQLISYYEEPRRTVGGISVSEFSHSIDRFVREHPRWEQVAQIARHNARSAARLIVHEDGSLRFPIPLLNIYGNPYTHAAFIENRATDGTAGMVEQLVREGRKWDLVFFDSGELSCMVEWELLKDRIQVGGLAAFHDIYFPKSIKAFVVCASLLNDPHWKPVFLDESTPQGLFVAQRIS
ncbi:hypothetical protein ACFL2Q_02260 [Thermodesulfobacteriota bacterium]